MIESNALPQQSAGSSGLTRLSKGLSSLWWLPYLLGLIGVTCFCVHTLMGIWELESWDESIDELMHARSRVAAVQAQGLFPPSVRSRAQSARQEYLHDCVESVPMLRSAELQLAQLTQSPTFSKVKSLQQAVEQLKTNPRQLHFVSKPSAPGTVFRDRQYTLTQPTEVDLCDIGRLLVLLEGAPTQDYPSPEPRPILWIQDLKLERMESASGHYLLDLGVLEREWKGRKSPPR